MAINNSINSKQLLSSADSPAFTAVKTSTLLDSNSVAYVTATATASAVNNANIANSATGNAVVISAIGTDTNINLNVMPKGTGVVVLGYPGNSYIAQCNGFKDSNGNGWITTSGTASAVNAIYIENAATGNPPYVCSGGSDSAVQLGFGTLGNTGIFNFKPGVGGGGAATQGAALRLYYANAGTNTYYSALAASTSLTSSTTWTLPLADGAANTFLQTNGSGQLTFAAAGGSNNLTLVNQTAHGFTQGQIVYPSSTANTFSLSKADSAADAECGGAVDSVVDANNFYLLTGGTSNNFSGLTAGTPYFMSDVTAGAYTATPPTTAGHVIKCLFMAVSTTKIVWLNYVGEVINGGATSPTFSAPSITTYTTGSGTYTTPAGALYLKVQVWGGGGSGSGGNTNLAGSGGGAGGYCEAYISTPAATYSYAVGASVAGGASSTNGNAGNASTFGTSLLTANGGSAGVYSASPPTNGGAGGTATGGTRNVTGGSGMPPMTNTVAWWGGAGGAACEGGPSVAGPVTAAVGNAGIAPGGGGSSGTGANAGGASAAGQIVVIAYYQ